MKHEVPMKAMCKDLEHLMGITPELFASLILQSNESFRFISEAIIYANEMGFTEGFNAALREAGIDESKSDSVPEGYL